MEETTSKRKPLTRKEALDAAVSYLKIKAPKLLAKKANESENDKERRNERLKSILSQADTTHLENEFPLLSLIPEMHLSWAAMTTICCNRNLMEIYTYVITALYNENHLPEQERIWLAMDSEELINRLTADGMVWSRGSKRMIEKQYPNLYKRFFEPQINFNYFD